MASEDAAISRIVVTVSNQLAPRLARLIPPPSPDVDPVLLSYLESPDFAEVARQVVLWRAMRGDLDSGLSADLREQIVQGLRLSGASADPKSVLHALTSAEPLRAGSLDTSTAVGVAHLASAVKNNTFVLRRASSLEDFHDYARQLRVRVAAMHGEMRLPHIGVSRSVPYDELYVRPTLSPGLRADDLSLPGRRTVLLGDPGAGKSTLAAKLTHDIALDDSDRVPFLLVLRDFTSWFREGGRELLRYFEHVCSDPYNLTAPRDVVEYLLRNGRAVVVLDGLDELVEPELRRRVVRLVEGFAHQYPLTPIVVTARKVGYLEAPLSESLFDTGTVDDFDSGQVADYATHWFALDAATPSHERAKLADAFLRESRAVEELRRNPLLLALLCAMYSSEHYLPRNLAQVYERCAVMLFDRWDSMRGIALPVQFQGRLRAAVQHLAWHQFTAPESGRALARSRIVQVLAGYLESKSFDSDEALGAAEQFTEFCTGRAWILTDVGATRAEPLFGFTHRTFLEYFAAEHLVRKHPDARSLWSELRLTAGEGPWDVVGRIALQLRDRNIDDGADEILRLALQDGNVSFPASALHYVAPQPVVVRQIVHEALERYLTPVLVKPDMALAACLYDALPSNAPVIHRALLDRMTALSATRLRDVSGLVQCLVSTSRVDPALRLAAHELRRDMASQSLLLKWPWLHDLDSVLDLVPVVAEVGPRSLLLPYSFLGETIPAPATTLLSERAAEVDRTGADELAVRIAEFQRPWVSLPRWRDHRAEDRSPQRPRGLLGEALETLLFLPHLEAHVDHNYAVSFAYSLLLDALIVARKEEEATNAYEKIERAGLPTSVRKLLIEWIYRRFNVFDET